MTDHTIEEPAPGVRIAQPRRGFRYGAEAFWLAGFALELAPEARTALELGTGSGVVALLLASRGLKVRGIELRSEWQPLWERTLAGSRAPAELVRADVLDPIAGTWDLVVSNPPFFAQQSGPEAPDPWKRAARTESTATLADFVRVGLGALEGAGVACFVVPVEREQEVLACGRAVRWLRVGRRRSLIALSSGGSGCAPEAVPDDGTEVRGWYAAVGARFARPPRDD